MKFVGIPSFNADHCAFNGLDYLADAMEDGNSLNNEKIVKAFRLARRLCHHPNLTNTEEPMAMYADTYNVLSNYINYRPHKIKYIPIDYR